MLAFSLAVALVGGNSVATFAAEPTKGTESGASTQAATDEEQPAKPTEATATFSVNKTKGYFDFGDGNAYSSKQGHLEEQDYAITYFPEVHAEDGYVWTGWKITDQDGNSTTVGTEYVGNKTWMFAPKAGNVNVVATFKKKAVATEKKTATLWVAYVDENAQMVGKTQQKLTKEGNDGEKYTFSASDLEVPEGYKLVKATWEKSVAYGNEEFVNVTVKKKETEKADAVLRVHYVDENGTPLDGQQYIVTLKKNGPVGEKATFVGTEFTAPEGYELVEGVSSQKVEYGKDADINVKVKAIEEEKEARDVIVNFNVDPEKGQFTDPADAKVVTYTIKEDSGDQFLVPTVAAKEGYEFTGWLVNGKEEGFWSADAKTFGITGLAHFPEGSDTGYITVTAQFKEIQAAKRSVTINVAIDPEKGEFVGRDDKSATITYTDLDEFAEAPILLPEVKAKDGYRLAGWTVEGKESLKLDANATTLGFAGLAHFNDGENVGYISVEPIFEEVKKEETKAVVNATVVVDPEKGTFDGYEGATQLDNQNLQESDYQLGFIPTVTAKEGYTWTGWEVTNKAGEVIYNGLDTTTSSIVFPKGVEDDYTVTATFTKDETPVDPSEPSNPTDPSEPSNPTDPAQPTTPSTDNTTGNTTTGNTTAGNTTVSNTENKTEKPVIKKVAKKAETTKAAKNENKKAPKTGDESMPISYILTLVGAAVAAVIVLIKRKRTI